MNETEGFVVVRADDLRGVLLEFLAFTSGHRLSAYGLGGAVARLAAELGVELEEEPE